MLAVVTDIYFTLAVLRRILIQFILAGMWDASCVMNIYSMIDASCLKYIYTVV